MRNDILKCIGIISIYDVFLNLEEWLILFINNIKVYIVVSFDCDKKIFGQKSVNYKKCNFFIFDYFLDVSSYIVYK